MTKIEFTEVFFKLGVILGKTPTTEQIDGYYWVLSRYDLNEFKLACANLLKTHKYNTLPLPATFVELLEPKTEDLSIVAFDTLDKAVQRYGAYKSVSFEDKTINAVVEALGGWVDICNKDAEEWKWFKKEFITTYESFKRLGRESSGYLLGLSEQQNRFSGYETKEDLVLIGEKGTMLEKIPYQEKSQLVAYNGKFEPKTPMTMLKTLKREIA
ncbi:hypothetical protein YZ82_08185 [Campylobacter hyointestinalis]|uniref:DUF6475 domain-containing protein n=1 Tax=Campylobacter hyointestinalis TaxID=198 RepID=A0A562X8G9_CAMHY|nr:DUF6475 domain-containing protein [Campylobacter hyointestinalis]TWO17976.1 hypothetical protein YZ82_08185 [Campylobacter hyointestinalis]